MKEALRIYEHPRTIQNALVVLYDKTSKVSLISRIVSSFDGARITLLVIAFVEYLRVELWYNCIGCYYNIREMYTVYEDVFTYTREAVLEQKYAHTVYA